MADKKTELSISYNQKILHMEQVQNKPSHVTFDPQSVLSMGYSGVKVAKRLRDWTTNDSYSLNQ